MILLVVVGCLDGLELPWNGIGIDRPLSELTLDELVRICEREAEAFDERVVFCADGTEVAIAGTDEAMAKENCVSFVEMAAFDQCDATTGDLVDALRSPLTDEELCGEIYDNPFVECLQY